jgi:hypothetical protein
MIQAAERLNHSGNKKKAPTFVDASLGLFSFMV